MEHVCVGLNFSGRIGSEAGAGPEEVAYLPGVRTCEHDPEVGQVVLLRGSPGDG